MLNSGWTCLETGELVKGRVQIKQEVLAAWAKDIEYSKEL